MSLEGQVPQAAVATTDKIAAHTNFWEIKEKILRIDIAADKIIQ